MTTLRRNVFLAAAAPPAAARALPMEALRALNPASAKAAMLYTRRTPGARNAAARGVVVPFAAGAIHGDLAQIDLGETP